MVPADPAGMALAHGQGQVGPVAKDASQRGVLAHGAQELAGIARLPGTCRRKAFASWLRLASAGAWFTACRRIAFRSAWLNATGLPCMLLEVAALAAISPDAERGQAGHGELGEGLPDSGQPVLDRCGGLAGQ
jgi:hypothetical protein